MRFFYAVALFMALGTARAQSIPQAGPVTVPGVCIVDAPLVATKLSTLCGIPATPEGDKQGQAGFRILNLTATPVCLGGSDVNTTTTVGGKCYPTCNSATTCDVNVSIRGPLRSWYVIAGSATKIYVIYGSTP